MTLAFFPLPSREMSVRPNLEKSATKLEKGRESAITLEKGLSVKVHLNAINTRIAFHASL
jgi:hypothetical protein